MPSLTIYQVDAFTNKLFGGNPAAVVPLEEWLDDELMQQIAEVVKGSGWTQVEAATRCRITQPRINDLLRGRVSRFSIDALVNIGTALGRTVHFELEPA